MGDDVYTVDPKILHENEHYSVHVLSMTEKDMYILDSLGCAYSAGYGLVSKATGIIELVRTSLPDVLYNAEHLGKIMDEKPYLWLRQTGEAKEGPKTEGFDFSELN